jgi:hypothetical protein
MTGQASYERGVSHGCTSEMGVTSMRHGKRIPSRHATVAADPSVSRGPQGIARPVFCRGPVWRSSLSSPRESSKASPDAGRSGGLRRPGVAFRVTMALLIGVILVILAGELVRAWL